MYFGIMSFVICFVFNVRYCVGAGGGVGKGDGLGACIFV